LLDTGYAGIDEQNLYCRLDFLESPSSWAGTDTHLAITIEPETSGITYRLEVDLTSGKAVGWSFTQQERGAAEKAAGDGYMAIASNAKDISGGGQGIEVALDSILECKVPLQLLKVPKAGLLGVRFTILRDRLPLDSLP